MSQDQGASAKADRATRASPEPQERLGQKASVPCAFTPGPWEATYFTKPDGSPIKSANDVAETVGFSALQSDRGELYGVTLGGEDDGVVVCYTGNGPTSEANALLIAAAPHLYETLQRILAEQDCLGEDKCPHWVAWHNTARAALAKARGQ